MAHANPSPPVGSVSQQERLAMSWDVFSQLLRTKQWEADANLLRRPVDVLARAAAEAAPQWSSRSVAAAKIDRSSAQSIV